MASHEHLDQLANSPSTTSEEEDEANGSAAMSVENDTASAAAVDPMDVDDDSPAKPRLKLKIRASITSAGSASTEVAAAVNGVKSGANTNEPDENTKPPSTLHIVKESPTSVAPAAAVAVKMEDGGNDGDVKPVIEAPTATAVKKTAVKKEKANGEKNGSSKGEKKKKSSPTAAKVKAVKSETNKGSSKSGSSSSKTKTKSVKTEDGVVKKVKKKVKKEAANGASSTSSPGSSEPPKKKKKKLPKLPMSSKRKLPKSESPATIPVPAPIEATVTVSATVVGNDEVVDADAVAVATVVEEAPAAAAAKPVATTEKKPATNTVKRKATQQSKAIRLPPMTSPGLMMKSGTVSGFTTTPQSVFETSMAAAGYTTAGRTKNPHRGSSVQRVVGDMFDSNVAFALNFPTVVPAGLWSSDAANGLLKSLGSEPKKEAPAAAASEEELEKKRENGSRKRQRPMDVSEMMPVSFTVPYPDGYIEKRLQYVKEVQERERAIIHRQEMQEKLEVEQEAKDIASGKPLPDDDEPPKVDNPVKVPPIPVPPEAPPLSEFKGIDAEQYEGTHPIYLPKGKKNFVSHLDKDCFHVTDGRYFGLNSNLTADPHFVGANAPGLMGLTLSVGSGLATTSTTSGGSAAASVLAAPPAHNTKNTSSAASEKAPKKEASTTKGPKKTTASLPTAAKAGAKSTKFKVKHSGPSASATAADLRKVMEGSGGKELAEETRKCIIRAAVHASRSGKHGQAFLAPDGKAYPDASKAFAAHAGLKPCSRCKNNKQGAYHCRLRRKHKDLDYDGGNSPAELAPLLLIPMEDLLLNPKTLSYNNT